MREIYGPSLVGTIGSNNTVRLFGKKVYALGADKKNQVARIQGAAIEYCYGDEITTWAEEVFIMLKSRMSTANSCFDGTCNPDQPQHWFKKFLDSDADIYHQHYTIFDNPFLPKDFVENLCKEYAGTVYYNRFILGQWTRAEGAIYKQFAGQPEKFILDKEDLRKTLFREINIGIDFGGNKSKHAFVATGITRDYSTLVALKTRRHEPKATKDLENQAVEFVRDVLNQYGQVDAVYLDSAEKVLIAGIRQAAVEAGLAHIRFRDARKFEVNDRIQGTIRLMGSEKFFLTEDCKTLKEALEQAVWDEKAQGDKRLDDGSTDIDTLDAFEYSFEREINRMIRYG